MITFLIRILIYQFLSQFDHISYYISEPDCSCYPECTIVEITPELENPNHKVFKEPEKKFNANDSMSSLYL